MAQMVLFMFWVPIMLFGKAADPLPAISKAQKQLLASQRTRAIETLVAAVKKEQVSKNRQKIRQALNAISREFITEQGQKTYQVGLSLEKTNSSLAIQRYTEAQQQEDGNFQVAESLIRSHLVAKKCAEARAQTNQFLTLNPYAIELLELSIRAQICLKDLEAVRLAIRVFEKEDVPSWKTKWLKALSLLVDTTSQAGARTLFEQVRYENPKFPEVYYQLWRIAKNMAEERDELARRYVTLCKGLLPQYRQEFGLEPELCVHSEEVQADLDKQQHLDEENEKRR